MMSYANMIEEKRLKKGFIIATLISTIAGTFTAGLNLYDRVIHQNKRDTGQDDKIKDLEKRLADRSKGGPKARDSDLRDSLEYNPSMVRREYDRHVSSLGSKFAEGDLIAQTQLQGQIITLQGTVIKMLEEAMITGRRPDINSLYNASEFVRSGTVRALRDQYHRMLQSAPIRRPLALMRRTSSTPTLRNDSEWNRPQQKALTFNNNNNDDSDPLFCPYATELQRTDSPLDDNFAAEGCPACRGVIAIEPGRAWRLDKEVVRERSRNLEEREVIELVEVRSYHVTNRFLVKCHREGAGYACYLCYVHRDRDTLCNGMGSFVDHLSEKHGVKEFEMDPDIRDVTSPQRYNTY